MRNRSLTIFLDKRGIEISSFCIFGLIFLFKPNTLTPTLILLATIFALIFDKMLMVDWFSVIKYSKFRLIAIPFIAWFLTSLLIALVHVNETGFIFPSNAFRIGIASILLCFGTTKNSEKLFVLGLIIASITSFSWGTFEVFEKNARAQGTTNNPIHFGNITALIALICLSLALLETRFTSNIKLILLTSTLLSTLASAFSQTRSSALIIFCMIPLLFIAKKNNFNKTVLSILGIIIITITTLTFTSTEFQKLIRIDQIFDELGTNKKVNNNIMTGHRYEMWHSAWISFKENPITGLGPGKFENSLKQHISSGKVNSTETFNQPHSDILHAASSGGIIKLASYFSLLIFPFYFFYLQYKRCKSREDKNIWPVVGMQAIAAYFLFGLTNSNFDLQIYSTIYAIQICILAKFSLNSFDEK